MSWRSQKLAQSLILQLLLLALVYKAQGQIYVGNSGSPNAIEEYSTVGTVINLSFITNVSATGIALDSSGRLYLTDAARGAVAVYTVAGTPINTNLITGLNNPRSIALDGNGNIFVAIYGSIPGQGVVGEYTTAGATVNASLISGLRFPYSIALDGKGNLFVANQGNNFGYSIGKYTTSGGTVNSSFLTLTNIPAGIVVDSSGNLYVANYGYLVGSSYTNGSIGKYTAGGSIGNVVSSSLIANLNEPDSLALDGSGNLFIGFDGGQKVGQGFIGEYSTNGTVINPSLITGLTNPRCLAVNSMPPPAPSVALVKAVTPSFSNIYLGINYQLQVSGDMKTWTNCGSAFTATNTTMTYTQYWNVANWNSLFFRLEAVP